MQQLVINASELASVEIMSVSDSAVLYKIVIGIQFVVWMQVSVLFICQKVWRRICWDISGRMLEDPTYGIMISVDRTWIFQQDPELSEKVQSPSNWKKEWKSKSKANAMLNFFFIQNKLTIRDLCVEKKQWTNHAAFNFLICLLQ